MSPGAVLGLLQDLAIHFGSPHTNTKCWGLSLTPRQGETEKQPRTPSKMCNVIPAKRCEPLPSRLVLQGHQPSVGKDLSSRAGAPKGLHLLLLMMPKNRQTASRGRQAKGKACKSWERLCDYLPQQLRRSKYLRFQISTLPAIHHILP